MRILDEFTEDSTTRRQVADRGTRGGIGADGDELRQRVALFVEYEAYPHT